MKKLKFIFLLFVVPVLLMGYTNSNFSDTVAVPENQFTAGTWEPTPTPTPSEKVVINEVYYDVAPNKGTEDKNEWVELYNNTDASVSLHDWSLADAAGNVKIIHPEISIAAKGFIVLSNDGSTWTSFWTLPEGVNYINLVGSSAWLNNDGDRLALRDSSGTEIDWVAWGGFVSGWDLNASGEQSIARVTKGVDADSPSDWHILSSPNPGTNPHPASVDENTDEVTGDEENNQASSSAEFETPTPTPTPTPTLTLTEPSDNSQPPADENQTPIT